MSLPVDPVGPPRMPGYGPPPSGAPLPLPGGGWPGSAWTVNSPPDAATPRSYPQLMRGPGYRGWRSLAAIVIAVALAFVTMVIVSVIGVVYLAVSGAVDLTNLDPKALTAALMDNPVMFLVNNLGLASWIPVALLSVWAGLRWPARWVHSVTGRLRWRWLTVSAGIVTGVYLTWLGVSSIWAPLQFTGGDNVLALVLIVVVTTPLQAAGEEYLFRGVLTQAIGAWLRPAAVAVLVSGASTAVLFAALHSVGLPQNLWLWLGRFGFGVVASYLTWRTGGLESAIAFHTVNNVVALIPAILAGGLGDALANPEVPWTSTAADLAVMAVSTGLLVLAAHKLRLQRLHDPALQPGGRGPRITDCWPIPPAGPTPVPGGTVLGGPTLS